MDSTSTAQRQPYSGPRQRIVISFDLGTTFSAASYWYIYPVVLFLYHSQCQQPPPPWSRSEHNAEETGSDAKVPTVIFYDNSGTLKAIGAETLETGLVQLATRNNWIKYYRFKLHLGSHNPTHIFGDLSPLKDLTTLFSDFYRYLYNYTKTYVRQTHHLSRSAWSGLERDIQFVLAHPNGWGGEQQALMRNAMVCAGIIPNDDSGHARISFVTEGEASLHFCLSKGLSEFARLEEGVTIIDAGGGTVDISTYSRVGTSRNNKSFQEITIPQCKYSGSLFVTERAKSYLHNMLEGTAYAGEVNHISDRFDQTAKLRFKKPQKAIYVQFSRTEDDEPALHIFAGHLKLDGSIVAGFFEPSVKDIIEAIDNERLSSSKNISASCFPCWWVCCQRLSLRPALWLFKAAWDQALPP
ncbi:hypothetical protein F5146DRAFT_1176465 [Armillaria mellea]|nr:hypothetical protein F5146DRAFT_1176465 [Armillaria mellea]